MTRGQKEKIIAEFISFTNAIPADASRICKKAGYRLDVATDLFYNDHLAQVNAERSMQSKSKSLSEGFEVILGAQFNLYQDPDDASKIEMEGLMRYLEALALTPEDPKVLCLCHLIHSPRLGVVERSAFVKHWTSVLIRSSTSSSSSTNSIRSPEDLIKFQIKILDDLGDQLRSDAEYFEEVYRFIFDFGRDEGQKSLALATAIAFWEMVLPLAPELEPEVFKPEYLEWWIELQRSRNKSISRDTWNLFLDFIVQVEDGFENYDETEAWPSVIDDYVIMAREKLKSQGMDVS